MPEIPFPPVIRIEPASACNLKCSHCPTGVLEMTRTIMKPPLFDRVIEEIAPHVPPIRVAVLYHGGEPFLNKHFLPMVRRVKDLGIPHVKTVSNAMLIKPEMCEAIVRSGLDAIEFSLDGESPDENDAVRINCDFERVAMIVRRMVQDNRDAGRPLQISVSTTQFQTVDGFKRGRKAPIPRYLADAFAGVEDEIQFKPTWAMQWPSGAPSKGYDILWDDAPRKPARSCSLIDDTLTIRANGDVVPCCFDLSSMEIIGNIADASLAEIWRGGGYQALRRDFAAGRPPKLCQGCVVVTGDKYLLRRDGPDDGDQRWIPASSLKGRASG